MNMKALLLFAAIGMGLWGCVKESVRQPFKVVMQGVVCTRIDSMMSLPNTKVYLAQSSSNKHIILDSSITDSVGHFAFSFMNIWGHSYDILIKCDDSKYFKWNVLLQIPSGEFITALSFDATDRSYSQIDSFYFFPIGFAQVTLINAPPLNNINNFEFTSYNFYYNPVITKSAKVFGDTSILFKYSERSGKIELKYLENNVQTKRETILPTFKAWDTVRISFYY